jgi:hypothetical protein
MRIGFDFDGVISRTPLSRAFHFIGRSLEAGYRKVIQTAKPNEWAIRFIKILEAKGHTIYIITGRPTVVAKDTAGWLREHGLGHLVKRSYHNPVLKYSWRQQIEHKSRTIKKLGMKVYVEDYPKVAKGIARDTGIEVVLHTGKPAETAKDVWDAIRDVGGADSGSSKGVKKKTVRRRKHNPTPQIIISVPHATGLPVEGASRMKGHDYIAEEMAKRLAERLRVPEGQVIFGDVPRDIIDLNRERARWKTEFRQAVRELIKRDPRNTIHLDVHSFRQNSKVYRDNDIAIVTTEKRARPYETELRDRIIAAGLRCKIYTEMLMDVVPEGRELGVSVSYLIEFNEGADAATKDRFADIVAEFINALAGRWPPSYPAHKVEVAEAGEVEPQAANPAAQDRLIRKFAEGATRGSAKNLHIVGDYLKSWAEIIAKRYPRGVFKVKERPSYGSQSSRRHCNAAKRILEGIGTVTTVPASYDFEDEEVPAPAEAPTPAPAPAPRRTRRSRVTPPHALHEPTPAETEYEDRRIGEMRQDQLRTRLGRMTVPQKVYAFARELTRHNLRDLAGEAYAKLARLGYNPDGTQIGTSTVAPLVSYADLRVGDLVSNTMAIPTPEYAVVHQIIHTYYRVAGIWMGTALEAKRAYLAASDENLQSTGIGGELSYYEGDERKYRIIERGITRPAQRPAHPATPSVYPAEEEEEEETDPEHETGAPARRAWTALDTDTAYDVLKMFVENYNDIELHTMSEFSWEQLPVDVKRQLTQANRERFWSESGPRERLATPASLAAVGMGPNRVGDLVKAHDDRYGVIAKIGRIPGALPVEGDAIYAIWEQTPERAKTAYMEATDEQLSHTRSEHGLLTWHEPHHIVLTIERDIRRPSELVRYERLVAFNALYKGDLIEIPRELTNIQGGRFVVVRTTGRLMYEGLPHGEDNSVWGIWEETPQAAKRKYLQADEDDFRPFIPGLMKHEALEGDAYRVIEHGIFRTVMEREKWNDLLLASVGTRTEGGMAELYYPWPEEPDPRPGEFGGYSIVKNATSRLGKAIIIVSTHPEIALHYGKGWVTPVKMMLTTLQPEKILPHRVDFRVPETEEHTTGRFSMVEEAPTDEPFNVRAVGIVRANPQCVLCNDLKTPKVHYQDPFIILCDDIKHQDSILGMIKRHAEKPEPWEEKWLMTALNYYAGEAFPDFEIVETMNTEPSHWHIHARKAAENPHQKERSVLEVIDSVR